MRSGDGPDFAASPSTTRSGRLTLAIRFHERQPACRFIARGESGNTQRMLRRHQFRGGSQEWLRNCDGWDTGLG